MAQLVIYFRLTVNTGDVVSKRVMCYANLIKFLPNSELCSMLNNKVNLFRFSHSKSNKFNAVSGRRTNSQGPISNKRQRLTCGVIDFDKDATRR